jgi:hypothetical protein
MADANPGYIPPQIGPSAQKQIEDMKAFMSKDVTELAASLKEQPFTFDIVQTRGRKMVIPRAPAARSVNATMFACLYALQDNRIDAILAAVNARAHFMADDGQVTIQPIVMDVGVQAHKEVNIKGVQPQKDLPRNILLEDDPPVFDRSNSGQMVAVMTHAGSSQAYTVGTIWAWDTKQSPACHIVRTVEGKDIEVPEADLRKIDSMAEFIELCAKAKQH